MSFFEIIKLAFTSIYRNKMRSFLTSLGVVISIASVVAIVSLGQGAYYSVQKKVTSLFGITTIWITPTEIYKRGVHGTDEESYFPFKYSDLDAITRECHTVEKISPLGFHRGQVIYGNKNASARCWSGNENILKILSYEINSGRFFDSYEALTCPKVCVVGPTVVENLFDNNIDPIGKKIRYNKMTLEIIGVTKPKGESVETSGRDNIIFIPYSLYQKQFIGTKDIYIVLATAKSVDLLDYTIDDIEETLRRKHKLAEWEENGFEFNLTITHIEKATYLLNTIVLFITAIASISLLVGGIVIMNTMLVSVTERTAEIGIHMAIGAKASDIMWQFLVESVVLTCFGGIIGILCGVGIAEIIGKFASIAEFAEFIDLIGAHELTWITEFKPIISTNSIVISFAFSLFVGVFFGLYPAYKASQLDPIEALRYE